jgi:hypothetical protein
MGKKKHKKPRGGNGDGARFLQRPKKRVAIVGTGPGYHLAPHSGEVWTINDLGVARYCTMIWDMHNFNWTFEECVESYRHLRPQQGDEETIKRIKNRFMRWATIKNHCRKNNIILMSLETYQDVPTSRAFPVLDVAKRFGTHFMSSGISYMIAYALYTGHTHVDIYGCNVEWGSEWAFQRDCICYWMGFAKGRGVKITVSGTEFRPLRIHPSTGGRLYSYNLPQPETGIKRTEEVDYRGKKMVMTTWDEGPQHEHSPPIPDGPVETVPMPMQVVEAGEEVALA